MSAKPKLSPADRLERKLAKIRAARRKLFRNENVVRLEKNGDLSYETVRTFSVPASQPPLHAADPADANFYTEPPISPENGQLFPAQEAPSPSPEVEHNSAQPAASTELPNDQHPAPTADQPPSGSHISIHDDRSTGQQIQSRSGLPGRTSDAQEQSPSPPSADDTTADPLEELLTRALSRPKRGRPAAFDEHSKGKLVALLSLGMSLRQAAAVLGVSHGTIHNTLKADPALAEEITAARFQAQLQPLACVIREARRSWKAATWLLKYLDAKIATHEETPDERRARQARESDEFFAHAPGPKVKTRHVLG